jgi:[ribosomal protein S18]-alanine N-acetyltransferase
VPMKRQLLVTRSQASPSARTIVRGLHGRDVKRVLAINHQAFPADPWTRETASGWLARSPLGSRRRSAARLEQCIRLAWLSEVIMLGRLVGHVARHSPGAHYWVVAETAEKVVGFASLNTVAGRAEIRTIAVDANRAGQGIGNALLSDLVATSADRGCHEVFLHVRADNRRARNLYERAGFTEMAVRQEFYQPSGTDAIVMRLSALVGIMTEHHGYRSDEEAAEGRHEAQRCRAAPQERTEVAASKLAQVPQYPSRQN